jgi:uncharacterized phage protein (TIGR01671 family)
VDDTPIKHYHIENMTIGAFPNEFQSGLSETVNPNTVGQFTGLTDKNGKKIFDGDIVRCISMTDVANMVVIFEDGEFRMVLCEKYKDYIPGCGFYAIRCFDKEVIGNIHDNPELLEVPNG